MSKYGNVKTVVDNITFASKREATRYRELKLMEKAGVITFLELQPKFVLPVNGQHICTYIADFTYHDVRLGKSIIEDAKGVKTAVYRLKKKLVKAIHGLEIQEI